MYSMLPKILTPTESLEVHYPAAHHYQDLQQKGFWTANEVNLEKDIQPLLTETTEAELHGIITVLKLFTSYELRADEFWSGVIKKMFPRPEIQELAALNGAVELSVHRRVYDKLNQLLNKSNDEFYQSYKQSPTMKARMDFLDRYLIKGDNLERIAAFCFAEGVVLFSSFAFIMSFRANGNNKLPNIGLAIKFSARDEDCHNQAASWLFRQLRKEMEELGEDTSSVDQIIYDMSEVIRQHEYEIIAEIFSKGKIDGITELQMRHFIDSRIDVVLARMGLKKIHFIKYNPIAEWFDKIVEAYQYVDFFAGQGSSYSRGWDKNGFVWERRL
jgi:ribonucleotide reductase beta subunit family protein with ferritin-like domain